MAKKVPSVYVGMGQCPVCKKLTGRFTLTSANYIMCTCPHPPMGCQSQVFTRTANADEAMRRDHLIPFLDKVDQGEGRAAPPSSPPPPDPAPAPRAEPEPTAEAKPEPAGVKDAWDLYAA